MEEGGERGWWEVGLERRGGKGGGEGTSNGGGGVCRDARLGGGVKEL